MVLESDPTRSFFSAIRVVCGGNVSKTVNIHEGSLGTVRSCDRERGVTVLWDVDEEQAYAPADQLNLRVYDLAQCNITHPFVRCNACDEWPISGLRWKCTVCNNVDLCSQCYHSDTHDLDHEFSCITVSWSGGSVNHLVRRRSESKKVALIGILPGATVVRGRDWRWEDQDGGEGAAGTVTGFNDDHGNRNVVTVAWSCSGSRVSYRVGADGFVDLKLVETPPDIYFVYLDHLPLLRTYLQDGFPACASMVTEPSSASAGKGEAQVPARTFSNGSYVRVSDDLNAVEQLQAGHGEWVNCMSSVLGQVGKVVGKTGSGDVRVNFGQLTFTVNAEVLTAAEREVGVYYVNDYVKVESQVDVLLQHQRDAGLQQCSTTERIAGVVGRVTSLLSEDRVEVIIKAQKYLLSASALQLVSSVPEDLFTCGDVVLVLDDFETVKTLQNGHGGWTDDMHSCVNSIGRVLLVDDVDDVLVSMNNGFYYFHPCLLTKVQSATEFVTEWSDAELRVRDGDCSNVIKRQVRKYDDYECDLEFKVADVHEQTETTMIDNCTHDNQAAPLAVAPISPTANEQVNGAPQVVPLEDEVLAKLLCEQCCTACKNIVFQCGHSTCQNCAEQLRVCSQCSVEIRMKIRLL